MWGQRICGLGPLSIKAQGPRRGESVPRTYSESPNSLKMQLRMILSSASQGLEGKNDTSSKAASKALPKEKVSRMGLTWGYSVGVVQGKDVTFALNAPTGHIDRKIPLNSVASVIATNRKWGKVANGTDT